MTKPKLPEATPATPEVVAVKKNTAGRPKNKETCKQAQFNLPVSLLDRIDSAADEYFGNNKSRLVVRAVEKLLAELEK